MVSQLDSSHHDCCSNVPVLTVSPKIWNLRRDNGHEGGAILQALVSLDNTKTTTYLLFSPRNTPAVTGPLWIPTRSCSSRHSSPRRSANSPDARSWKFFIHSCANLVIMRTWSGCAFGKPVTATSGRMRKEMSYKTRTSADVFTYNNRRLSF